MKTKNTFRRVARQSGFLLFTALAVGAAFAADSAPKMSKAEVKDLIGKASTPADHQRLAAYFTQKAEAMDAEAVEHGELAREYAKNPNILAMKQPMSGHTAAHCKYFAQAARKAAAEDRSLAAVHENMAKMPQK